MRGDSVFWMSSEMIRQHKFVALEQLIGDIDGLVLGVLRGHKDLPMLAGVMLRCVVWCNVVCGGRAVVRGGRGL